LDGLGYVGGGLHTDHEWIDVSIVKHRLCLLTRLLMEISGALPIKTTTGTGSRMMTLGELLKPGPSPFTYCIGPSRSIPLRPII